jgi:valyl-tRNA synthetase
MPFITEEIWQALPRSQKGGNCDLGSVKAETIMLAEYPAVCESRSFPEAAAEMEKVMAVISGIRNVRGEMEVPPSKEIAVILSCACEESRLLMKHSEGAIMALARVADLAIGINMEKPEDASLQVAGDVQIFVPLKGMVDAVAEAERLIKEIGKIDKEIEMFSKKLENPSFVDRAPADVVAKEREKLVEVTARKALLDDSLKKIRTL